MITPQGFLAGLMMELELLRSVSENSSEQRGINMDKTSFRGGRRERRKLDETRGPGRQNREKMTSSFQLATNISTTEVARTGSRLTILMPTLFDNTRLTGYGRKRDKLE